MIASPDRTPPPGNSFDRPIVEVAPDLQGRTLVRSTPDGPITLRPTEAEAHDGRNDVMSGPPGHVYAGFTYGMTRRSA